MAITHNKHARTFTIPADLVETIIERTELSIEEIVEAGRLLVGLNIGYPISVMGFLYIGGEVVVIHDESGGKLRSDWRERNEAVLEDMNLPFDIDVVIHYEFDAIAASHRTAVAVASLCTKYRMPAPASPKSATPK